MDLMTFLGYLGPLLLGFGIGLSFGSSCGQEKLKKEAINLGLGQYNPQTAEFEWKYRNE